VVDGKYVAGAEFTLPKELGLYGWTYANLGDRQPLLVALDDDDHLMVYSGLTMAWKSAEQYFGAGLFVYKPVTGIDAVLSGRHRTGQIARVRSGAVVPATNTTARRDRYPEEYRFKRPLGARTGAGLNGLARSAHGSRRVWIRQTSGRSMISRSFRRPEHRRLQPW
jgi:hypothetical protein